MRDPRVSSTTSEQRARARQAHRERLTSAVEYAERAIEDSHDDETMRRARQALIEALAACAEDSRYGAGQLSRGAQRAPTVAACEEGWERVESIVRVAEAYAQQALELATMMDAVAAWRVALRAVASARSARKVIENRNRAFTFHTDPTFSFGEGWYLAAAAVLARVPIQVEPDQEQTPQVERFLTDAGLADLIAPYRSRPRANKSLTDIVARGFQADARGAQSRLRRAFLGEGPLLPHVVAWIDGALEGLDAYPKVLLWVRYGRHHANRNTCYSELLEVAERAFEAGLMPVLVGDALRGHDEPPQRAVDWTLFWKKALFQGVDMRRAQLHLFEHMRRSHRLVGQIGVTTAGMDGPALMGLPTMYLSSEPNVRMREWVGAVPGYEEMVREEGYLERISLVFARWGSEDGDPQPLNP